MAADEVKANKVFAQILPSMLTVLESISAFEDVSRHRQAARLWSKIKAANKVK